jgi:hypothetical protein
MNKRVSNDEPRQVASHILFGPREIEKSPLKAKAAIFIEIGTHFQSR